MLVWRLPGISEATLTLSIDLNGVKFNSISVTVVARNENMQGLRSSSLEGRHKTISRSVKAEKNKLLELRFISTNRSYMDGTRPPLARSYRQVLASSRNDGTIGRQHSNKELISIYGDSLLLQKARNFSLVDADRAWM